MGKVKMINIGVLSERKKINIGEKYVQKEETLRRDIVVSWEEREKKYFSEGGLWH